MDKTQEAKFEKARAEYVSKNGYWDKNIYDFMHDFWQACLEANGIGEEPRERCSCMVPHNGPCKSDRIVDKDRESNLAEAIPEGYFKIGEEVEINHDHLWRKGKVIVVPSGSHVAMPASVSPEYVRRIPAWKPKDGEAVLVGVDGKASVGYVENGTVYADRWRGKASIAEMKPFDASKIGKPWSEIV